MIKAIDQLLTEHPFFSDLPAKHIQLIGGCGRIEIFKDGKFLAHEGDPAEHFYVIRSGKLAVQTQAPGRGAVVLETLGSGEVVGWSWLIPPYRWTFDVKASPEAHVISLDGKCLRAKAEADSELGYLLMKRFASVMAKRLSAARLQMMDVYGVKS